MIIRLLQQHKKCERQKNDDDDDGCGDNEDYDNDGVSNDVVDNVDVDNDYVDNGNVHPFSDGAALVDVDQVENHSYVFLCHLLTMM